MDPTSRALATYSQARKLPESLEQKDISPIESYCRSMNGYHDAHPHLNKKIFYNYALWLIATHFPYNKLSHDLREKRFFHVFMTACHKGYSHLVVALLRLGIDPNHRTYCQHTPLMYAARASHDNVLPVLMSLSKPTINWLSGEKQTALSYFIQGLRQLPWNNALSHLRIFYANGADFTLGLVEGKSPLDYLYMSYIVSFRSRNWKFLTSNLQGLHEFITDARACFANKHVAHTFALHGTSFREGIKISWEGSSSQKITQSMAETLTSFSETCPEILDKNLSHQLSECLTLANTYFPSIAKMKKCITEGLPTIVHTGYSEHASSLLFWGKGKSLRLVILCDRQTNEHCLSLTFIDVGTVQNFLEKWMSFETLTQDTYVQLVAEFFPAIEDAFTQALRRIAALPQAVVGNCRTLADEAVIKVFMALSHIEKNRWTVPAYETQLKKIIDPIFNQWLLYHKIETLKKELKSGIDPLLAQQAYSRFQKEFFKFQDCPFITHAYIREIEKLLKENEIQYGREYSLIPSRTALNGRFRWLDKLMNT